MRFLLTVASRIYALFVAKSTSVPVLRGGGGRPILAIPGFWKRLLLQHLSYGQCPNRFEGGGFP